MWTLENASALVEEGNELVRAKDFARAADSYEQVTRVLGSLTDEQRHVVDARAVRRWVTEASGRYRRIEARAAQDRVEGPIKRTADARSLYAKAFEHLLLQEGHEVVVGARGEYATVLWLQYVKCGRAFVVQLESNYPKLRELGFRRFECVDGFGSLTYVDL